MIHFIPKAMRDKLTSESPTFVLVVLTVWTVLVISVGLILFCAPDVSHAPTPHISHHGHGAAMGDGYRARIALEAGHP